ncbi:MAG TPA: hypothetical protein VFT98_03695, partial [Myxococcota bacterium]|nr:hypothetical protein [Myxococcota bacterium]
MARLLSARRARFATLAIVALVAAPAAAREESYEVEIKAPRSLKKALETDLDLMRWREAEEPPDAELLERLAHESEPQAREILAARGYVSATVESEAFTDEKPMRVRITVKRGPVTRVRAVDIQLRGAITESGDPEDAVA